MKSINLAGLVLTGILAVAPTAALAHGGGGGGFRGVGGHFVGGGSQFAGRTFAGHGFAGNSFAVHQGMRFARHDNHFRDRDDFRHRGSFFFGDSFWYDYPYYSYSGDNAGGYANGQTPSPDVINTGNSRPVDSNPGHIDSGYISPGAVGQQRIVVQDSNEKTGSRADPMTPPTPVVPQATPATARTTQRALQPEAGVFGKLVLVSWLDDDGKDVIFVENIETKDVQRITSRPNIDNFRIVEIRPNADPRQFEAIISNGIEQGAIRFRY